MSIKLSVEQLENRKRCLAKLSQIFKAINAIKIDYCVLRNYDYEELGHDLETDILIAPRNLGLFESIMNSYKFNRELDLGQNPHIHYRDKVLHFDIVTSLAYGEANNKIIALDYRKVLRWKILANNLFYVPSEIDEAIMLLFHNIYDKCSFSKYNINIINTLNKVGVLQCIKRITELSSLIE